MENEHFKMEYKKRFVPYAGIERHGVVGDRRSAALIAADGTLDWFCLPDYDGAIVFGGVMDWMKGGFWRLGPARLVEGRQRYFEDAVILETEWALEEGTVVLQDLMLWPDKDRPPEREPCRTLVRNLRCTRGKVRCDFDMEPRDNFNAEPEGAVADSLGVLFRVANLPLRLWASQMPQLSGNRLHGEMSLAEGQEFWSVLEINSSGQGWSVDSARKAVCETRDYWSRWIGQSHYSGNPGLRRSALMLHLMSYAPTGAVIAAPTCSLPQRIGGDWNFDYRFSWVRDASLSVGMLARLGAWGETEQYLQWIAARYRRFFGPPLQVFYGIHGEKRARQNKLAAAGYRGSKPVLTGNKAYKQFQLGSLGFLIDCVWIYLKQGGSWREEYWKLIKTAADYCAGHWHEPDNGIWELPQRQHYVSSRVLCWVALDRAIKIREKIGVNVDVERWRAQRDEIHREVIEQGWSERLGAFRQRYEAENLDAAALLTTVFEFLPGDDPRVLSTIERIEEHLTINGLVHRFDPFETPGVDQLPMGQMEGAFLPCNFWLATAWIKAGKPDKARVILQRAEKLAGEPGLFAEGVDARSGAFLGNTPLLFSHAEYSRAKLELDLIESGQAAP